MPVHKIQNCRKWKANLRYCAKERANKNRPERVPGGENAADREKSGGTTSRSILALGNGQLPVQRVLVVLQIGAVGQDDNIAYL